MTDDDKTEMLLSMSRTRVVLQEMEDMCEKVADACKQSDASGLAFSLLMIKEAVGAYSKELARFVKTALDE